MSVELSLKPVSQKCIVAKYSPRLAGDHNLVVFSHRGEHNLVATPA
jgi:hypothetical protein